MLGIPRVKLSQGALGDPLEHLLGEDPEQLPTDVQGLEHRAVLVGTWGGGREGLELPGKVWMGLGGVL